MKVLAKQGTRSNVPVEEWIVDSRDELLHYMPLDVPFGSTAYVIDEKKVMILNGKGDWVEM
jgi:hypothetical protein